MNGLSASPYSPNSVMTANPKIKDNYKAPGINDDQSQFYKDFDKSGRTQTEFMQRAAFAGIKNLHSASFRKDSPIKMVQSRFPEKYQEVINVKQQQKLEEQNLSTQKVLQNLFPENQQQEQEYSELMEQSYNIQNQEYILEASFQAACENILKQLGSEEAWFNLQVEDKLLQFASFLSHMRKDLRLGGLIGIYLILRNNNIGDDIKRVVIEEIFTTLAEFYNQEDIFIVCSLEIIGLAGPNERTLSRIGIIKGLLCEPSLKHLQVNCFCTLMLLGYEGFQSVVELATKDYNSLQSSLLNSLLQVRAIQRIIIVPSILSQLGVSDNVKKQECLSILNRLGTLVQEAGGIPIIIDLLEEGSCDRQLIASILRTSGFEGEQILLKVLKYHKNYKARMAAASVLHYRLPQNDQLINVSLQLDQNEIVQLNAIPPGQICRYHGPISSLIQEEQSNSNEQAFEDLPFVEINSRDFLASLNRMISMNNEYFMTQFDNLEEMQQLPQMQQIKVLQNFNPQAINTSINQDTQLINSQIQQSQYKIQDQSRTNKQQISEQVIKLLSQQLLKEDKPQVREVIAASIGTIGLEEGQYCLDSLIKVVDNNSEDPNVKAMAVWAIGRLASQQTGVKSKRILVQALNDSYWKVRAAACTAVAQIGEILAQPTIPVLTKLLREGLVNRQTVAETMINVGPLGEQTLVSILKGEPENNVKLRECIVRSLALSNVNHPNIDFVIEILFQTSKDKNSSVRKSSLLSLDILHKKAFNDQVTYLKARHLLPFFYRCLSDKDKQVRTCALLCIQNFGPQGELMFIEGLTKEKNPLIRCECAKGLGQIGANTFRTLLLSLHDSHSSVREAASQAIIKNMSPEDIDNAFKNKDHQRQTIKCAIREVFAQNLQLSQRIMNYLEEVLLIFEEGQYQYYSNKENKITTGSPKVQPLQEKFNNVMLLSGNNLSMGTNESQLQNTKSYKQRIY